MKRWVPILVTIPLLMGVLAVEPAAAVTKPRTPPSTSSPGYWLVTATGATYAYNAPYLGDIATNKAGNPLDDIGKSDCGNGPGTPIPEATQCVGISANASGQGYWVGQSSYFVQNGVAQYADSGIPQGYVEGGCNGPSSTGSYQPTPLVGIATAPIWGMARHSQWGSLCDLWRELLRLGGRYSAWRSHGRDRGNPRRQRVLGGRCRRWSLRLRRCRLLRLNGWQALE